MSKSSSARRGYLFRLIWAALSVFALTLAVACGGGGSDGSSQQGAPGEADSGPTKLRVAVPPSIFATAVHLGVREGVFSEAGLDVEPVDVLSTAEALPQVLSGDLQFTILETQSAFQSVSEGMPIVFAAPMADFATEPAPDNRGFASLLVLEGKGIDSPKDLEGRTVGTNAIGGAGYYAYVTAIDKAGADISKLRWVETPGPRAIAALRQGQVDAVVIAEPMVARAFADGGVESILTADDIYPGAPQFGFAASEQWIAENEQTAKTFRDAMITANQRANIDRAAVEPIIDSIVDLPPEVLSQVKVPPFSTDWWTPDQLEPTRQMIIRFKVIDEAKIPANEDVMHVYSD